MPVFAVGGATGTIVADKLATADGVVTEADAEADADVGAATVGLLDADAGAVAVAA